MPLQLEDAQTKGAGVVNCLNRHYSENQKSNENITIHSPKLTTAS
jgi:hypothetical protein